MNGLQKASTCSLLCSVSYCDIDQIPEKGVKSRYGRLSQEEAITGNKFHPEIEIIEVNTDLDHIHIQVSIPPKYSISEVVKMVKAHTGSAMRRKFPFLDKVYWGINGIWSIGYFVSTVGINEEVIRKYIRMQSEEDSGQAKLEF